MALLYSEKLTTGWQAPDFRLKDTEEKLRSLSQFTDKEGLLVVFTCNHCPYAKAAWPVIIELYHRYKDRISFVAINPNDERQYPEDSFEQMKKKKKDWRIPFPYLQDETQVVAKLYHAQCTPDPYLFKNEAGDFKLFYHGRINDNWQNPTNVKEKNLEEAIEFLLQNQSAPANQPPSMGCSIKWKEG